MTGRTRFAGEPAKTVPFFDSCSEFGTQGLKRLRIKGKLGKTFRDGIGIIVPFSEQAVKSPSVVIK